MSHHIDGLRPAATIEQAFKGAKLVYAKLTGGLVDGTPVDFKDALFGGNDAMSYGFGMVPDHPALMKAAGKKMSDADALAALGAHLGMTAGGEMKAINPLGISWIEVAFLMVQLLRKLWSA